MTLLSSEAIDKLHRMSAPAESGCTEWQGGVNDAGYGILCADNSRIRAHRAAWEAHNEREVPDGMVVDHICGNRKCVKPDHLRVVDRALNTQYRVVENKNNSTGHRGVILDKRYNTYSAEVMAHGKRYRKSGFKTPEDAATQAAKWRQELHALGDFKKREG